MAIAAFLLVGMAVAVPNGGPVVVTGFAWAPFISPMGEVFRPHSPTDDTLADWFNQADRNHDAVLSSDEMKGDADRFFDTLDTDHNGEIEPEELVRYEWQLAPEIQVNAKRRRARGEMPATGKSLRDDNIDGAGPQLGPEGAARYALLNIPEPVAAADADFNRAISRAEFEEAAVERFTLLDRQRMGKLTLEELRPLLPSSPAKGRQKRLKKAPDSRVGQPLPPGM
jgi:Ca2+-binding EF-hand superfamily protein